MGRVAFGIVIGAVGVSGAGLGVASKQHVATLEPGAVIGVVPVGDLTPEQAQKRVRLWWEAERTKTASFKSDKLKKLPEPIRWDALGLSIDDVASVAQVPTNDFWESTTQSLTGRKEPGRYELVFKVDANKLKPIAQLVNGQNGPKERATVQWTKAKGVQYSFETPGLSLDQAALVSQIPQSFLANAPIDIPLTEGAKQIPDEELRKIVEPMATFTTNFPASNRPRCANIQLASKILDGYVLMPGETFSFNGVVGERTLKRGFKVAGVYRNGRHDEGVGGGICQVSTTMYNAVLLSGLAITQRSNHSLPVAYVPLGRDCTVSFPSLDFKFTNNTDHPIALDSSYSPGTLTFNILGVKVPGQEIVIERGTAKSWSRGEQFQHDPSLPFGRVVLVDKGGNAHQISTFRIFKQDGKVVKRESLGVSNYPGAPRLYAKNMKAKAPAPAPAPPSSAPSAPAQPAAAPSETANLPSNPH